MDKNKSKYSVKCVQGETRLSKVIYAMLDILVFPNIHEVVRSINRKYPNLPFFEKVKMVIAKLDWDRTFWSFFFATLYWFDWISWESLMQILEYYAR